MPIPFSVQRVSIVPRSLGAELVYLDDASLQAIVSELTVADAAFLAAIDAYLLEQNIVFNVRSFGAVGDGVADDTVAIQATIDAAEAYAVASGQGATVYFPVGVYLISSTLTVTEDGICLVGHGAGGDTSNSGTIITPTAGFANNSYVLSVTHSSGTRPASGVRLSGLRIAKVATLTNTVHGIYWKAYRSNIDDVHIVEMSGGGLKIEGFAGWNAYQCRFENLQISQNGEDGISLIANVADCHFTNCMIASNRYGLTGGQGGSNHYLQCHFWSNINNIHMAAGGSHPKFTGCSFREAKQHNVLLDGTAGGSSIVNAIFNGCIFRADDALEASNTYDNLAIIRSAAGGTIGVIVNGCAFTSVGATDDVRYHINLSGAVAVDCIVEGCRLDANAATAAINHNSSAVRCLVNGLGRNVGDPASAGQWLGFGEDGNRVWNSQGSSFHTKAAGTWRAG